MNRRVAATCGRSLGAAVAALPSVFESRRSTAVAGGLLTDLSRLAPVLDASRGDDVLGYTRDWLKQCPPVGQTVVLPRTTSEVAAVLQYCHQHDVKVVPQGGNTGLVKGSVPLTQTEIVLSLRKMCRDPDIDVESRTAVCEAGLILQRLQQCAGDVGLLAPLSLGSEGSCTVGGNVATNAGGIHFARLGSIRSNVLGVEVITADGSTLDLMSAARKDNSGIDLKQLFIGSEGALGVVTRCILQLHHRPKSHVVAVIGVHSFEQLKRLYRTAQRTVLEVTSAFEVMDIEGLATTQLYGRLPPGCPQKGLIALIELRGSNEEHDRAKLELLCEEMLASPPGTSGESSSTGTSQTEEEQEISFTIAESASQIAQMWSVRETLPVELARLAGSGSNIYGVGQAK